MKRTTYFCLGAATQAIWVSIFQSTGFINVTPEQQGLAGVFFLIVAAVTAILKW